MTSGVLIILASESCGASGRIGLSRKSSQIQRSLQDRYTKDPWTLFPPIMSTSILVRPGQSQVDTLLMKLTRRIADCSASCSTMSKFIILSNASFHLSTVTTPIQKVSSSNNPPLLITLGLPSESSDMFPPADSNRSSTIRLLASRATRRVSYMHTVHVPVLSTYQVS